MPADNQQSDRIPRRFDADALDEAAELYTLLRKVSPADDLDIVFGITRSFSWGVAETAAMLSFLAAMGEPVNGQADEGVEN